MERINQGLLNGNLSNQNNKNVSSHSCDATMLQFFKSKTNLYYHVKNRMKLYELSQWLLSFRIYLERKQERVNRNKYSAGTELIVDFGFGYGSELSYKHHTIVLAQKGSKIFVVPLSSQTRRAFDQNGDIKSEYDVVGLSQGFTKDGIVLLLNDSRWISNNRVLNDTGNKISKEFLLEMKNMVFQRSLGEIYAERELLQSKVTKLEKTIRHKDSVIDSLNKKIAKFES